MIKVEIAFTVQGSADIEVPDALVTEAVHALAPGPEQEPDAYEIWDWILANRTEWVKEHARGRALLDAADIDPPGVADIDMENPSGLLPAWFYEQAKTDVEPT